MGLRSWAAGLRDRIIGKVDRENPVWDAIVVDIPTVGSGGQAYPKNQDFQLYLRAVGLFPLVMACVNRIAATAASVPWKVCNPDGSVNESHHLNELFSRPNPSPNGARQAFLQKSYQQWLLYGEIHWSSDSDTLVDPPALWLLEAERLNPVPSRSNAWPYESYIYDGGRREVRIPAERVFRVLRPNPISGWCTSPDGCSSSTTSTASFTRSRTTSARPAPR